jgi:hypothetical protein
MHAPSHEALRRHAATITAGACGLLVVLFGALSYSASLEKSATYDEPLHVLGGYMHRHHQDFRINPEDPALFGWLVSLPNPRDSLNVDVESQAYRAIVNEVGMQWPFIWITLYHTPGNDEQLVLNRSRAVCTILGVVLGAVIAWWSYRLAGAVAAVAATTLYAFCPNFLAHASIVKNDVPLSLVLLSLMFALWMVGLRGTLPRVAAVALLCGAALGIKYSGVLAGPLVVIALTLRAIAPTTWEVAGLKLVTWWQRLAGAVAICLLSAVVAWVCVWAVYGFRYKATPGSDEPFNMQNLEQLARVKELQAGKELQRIKMERRGETITDPALLTITTEELDAHQPAGIVRMILWLDQKQILPQGWLAGFLYTYATTLVRSTYLNGQIQNLGWWYFFPLAMLYKTPLATLAAAGGALGAALAGKLVLGRRNFRRLEWWGMACVLIAPVLYGATAINANLNLGLRHILPVYPFIFIGIGVVCAIVIARWQRVGLLVCSLLFIGLMVESILSWPSYLPFFNAAAGGERGGLHRLGDSNLDWGQDLKLLARWQEENPDTKLYLSYFGIADPESYGVKATHLPGGYIFAPYTGNPPQLPDQPGVLAISATNLQGIYLDALQVRPAYDQLRQHEPFGVLGGSIYLYRFPLPALPSDSAREN